MAKEIVLISVLALIVFFSGCTQETGPYCGDNFCSVPAETIESCPSDCEAPPTPPATTANSGGTPPSVPF